MINQNSDEGFLVDQEQIMKLKAVVSNFNKEAPIKQVNNVKIPLL
jgi:hypothetical protein